MANPISANKSYLSFYGAVWALIMGAHFAILYWYYGLPVSVSLIDSAVFNLLFGVIGLNLWYVVKYGNTENKGFLVALTTHAVSAAIVIGVWLSVSYAIVQNVFNYEEYHTFMDKTLPWRAVSGGFFYTAFILVYYVVVSYANLKAKTVEEARLKTLVKEVELSALKSQINPHFLFNSLNSISSLTISEPQKAQEMIIKLSGYLRYSLNKDDKELTTLKEELDNINLYLDIEKIRFRDRLIYDLNCSDECLSAQVPGMILQPLFENAIKHGVYQTSEPITVKVDCVIENSDLRITLQNNYDPEANSPPGAGMGIRNIRQRLFLIYKRRDLMEITDQENIYTTRLLFPQSDEV